MKYTVEGFNQAEMVNAGMDAVDAVLLRWFVDFTASGQMKVRLFEGRPFFWVLYTHVAEEVPLAGIKDKESVAKRFRKMADAKILTRHCFKDSEGTFSYFGFGELMAKLISDPSVSKEGRGPSQKKDGVRPKRRTIDSSSSDPSTKDPEEGAPSPEGTVPTKPVTDLFSSLYSERCGGAKFTFKMQYVAPTQHLIRAHGLPAVLEVVRGYFEGEWWFTKDKGNHGRRTWSYPGFLGHFDEVQSGLKERPVMTDVQKRNLESAKRLMGRA